ncbi:sugar phosphate isomerase/epimerase [Naasia sp. SYSU D00948]|uniref:sugar phosphate isomerase/epimerase family protein n=1 Tax=Naasia sp. SYSU D00948 TaxID=2817379 RepID=UPI001B30029E|nr:TIM barrel protein [Naasia sp. SYSU D00948]
MSWPVYAMDTGFYNRQGSYDFGVRCEIAKELGFDATYLTLWSDAAWADVPKLETVRESYGLDVAAIYCQIDMTAATVQQDVERVLELIATTNATRSIEIALMSDRFSRSDPAGDATALALLESLADAASEGGITLLLYPHALFWLERTSDAVRLCRAMDRPNVRAMFTAYHWYAVEAGPGLPELLDDVAPFLGGVNVCGSSLRPESFMGATFERLGEGELDAFDVLNQVRRVGYRGYVGLQGYSVQGDPYSNLRRSLEMLRDIERRIDAHPSWGDLNRSRPLNLPRRA